MSPLEAYRRLRDLRDGERAAANQARSKDSLSARERREAVAEYGKSAAALTLAMAAIATRITGADLIALEDEERVAHG